MRIASCLLAVLILAACGKQNDTDKAYSQLPASNPHLANSSAAPATDADAAEKAVFGSIHSKHIKH